MRVERQTGVEDEGHGRVSLEYSFEGKEGHEMANRNKEE